LECSLKIFGVENVGFELFLLCFEEVGANLCDFGNANIIYDVFLLASDVFFLKITLAIFSPKSLLIVEYFLTESFK
jgi:hypothetical protein